MKQTELLNKFDQKLQKLAEAPAPAPTPTDNIFANLSTDLKRNPHMLPLAMGGFGLAQDLLHKDKDQKSNPIMDAALYTGMGYGINHLLGKYNKSPEEFGKVTAPAPVEPKVVDPFAGSEPKAAPSVAPGVQPGGAAPNPAGQVNKPAASGFADGSGHNDVRDPAGVAPQQPVGTGKTRKNFKKKNSVNQSGLHEKLAYIKKYAFAEELQRLGVLPMDQSLQDKLAEIKMWAFRDERAKLAAQTKEMKNGLSGSVKIPGGEALKDKDVSNKAAGGGVRPLIGR